MSPLPLILCCALGVTIAVAAEPADPLKSSACEQALQQLQAQEARSAPAPQARASEDLRPLRPNARVQGLRREAARICLGGRADVPQAAPPQRQVVPPISVVPVAPPASARPAAPHATPAAPPRSQAPTVITSCDPTGCWASDGSRLNRMGQNLLGPRGPCTVQGNLLQCP